MGQNKQSKTNFCPTVSTNIVKKFRFSAQWDKKRSKIVKKSILVPLWRRVNGGSNSGSLKVAKSSLAAATVLTMEYRARENSVTISGSLKVAENSLAFYEGQQLPQYY